MCIGITDAEYQAGLRARAEHAERAEAALAGYDLLVTPVLSRSIPLVDDDELAVRAALTLYTFPFNALGWPALAIGGTQVVGRAGADGLVLAAGLGLEATLKP
jgi:Asp-tRNA(Asn)/Glu-tRNA(Gln) amidotransferase A subunit family amidase